MFLQAWRWWGGAASMFAWWRVLDLHEFLMRQCFLPTLLATPLTLSSVECRNTLFKKKSDNIIAFLPSLFFLQTLTYTFHSFLLFALIVITCIYVYSYTFLTIALSLYVYVTGMYVFRADHWYWIINRCALPWGKEPCHSQLPLVDCSSLWVEVLWAFLSTWASVLVSSFSSCLGSHVGKPYGCSFWYCWRHTQSRLLDLLALNSLSTSSSAVFAEP